SLPLPVPYRLPPLPENLPRLFLDPRVFGYNHASMMKVGSGQWIAGSFVLFTAHCPLPTAYCLQFSEELSDEQPAT
ncbi:MAG TPA: hypothetical protein VG324_04425, partial [Blastocatellia bacterium]|nr:hypothetical protein [Blastocatellia bacterium]